MSYAHADHRNVRTNEGSPAKDSGEPPAAPATMVELDRRVVERTQALAEGIGPDDLARPTPCSAWSLADLLGHMTAQHRGFAAAAHGSTDLADWKTEPGDPDPVGSYVAACDRVLEAFGEPDVLERRARPARAEPDPAFPGRAGGELPPGRLRGPRLGRRPRAWTVEVAFDREVLAAAMRVAADVPDGEARRAPGALFAPVVEVAADAPMLDRIVARLGRSPAWPAT